MRRSKYKNPQMLPIKRLSTLLVILGIPFFICFALEYTSFQGRVNANNINIRSDSTVSSEAICSIDKGYYLDVILESYDWYKIKLPKFAPSFIKKNLVTPIDEKTARVIKDSVNIRLKADESSAIIGRVAKNELVNIIGERREWYKIEPVSNSFGWIHKNFVDKVVALPEEMKKEDRLVDTAASPDVKKDITLEGTIKPKVITTLATHKLIKADGSIFLLKGNKGSLDTFNYHKVKVAGKILNPNKQKLPVIEITKIEALD